MSTKRFEKYLLDKWAHTLSLHNMVGDSKDPENQQRNFELIIELKLLDDIIHHFELFVKDDKDFLDSA